MTFGQKRKLVSLDLLQAHVWSAIFHPLFLSTYLFAVLFYVDLSIFSFSLRLKEYLLALIVIGTFILPMLLLLLLRIFDLIPSLSLPKRRSRPVPFLLTTLFYAATSAYFYFYFKISVILILILLIITLALFFLSLISLFYKMSAHALALGGSVGILCGFQFSNPNYLLFYPVLIGFTVSGFVLSARLRLRAHRPHEVGTGFLLAWFFAFLIISFLA